MGCCGGGSTASFHSIDASASPVWSSGAQELIAPTQLVSISATALREINAAVSQIPDDENTAIAWLTSRRTPELEDWQGEALAALAAFRLVCVDGCAWVCRLSTFREMGGLFVEPDLLSAYQSMLLVWQGQRLPAGDASLRRWRIEAETAIRREVTFLGLPWSADRLRDCQYLGEILHREPCHCGDSATVAIRACHCLARIRSFQARAWCVPLQIHWDRLADPMARTSFQCCESCHHHSDPQLPVSDTDRTIATAATER